MKITVLGAGRIGSALATSFHGRGHEVVVWNRSTERLMRIRDVPTEVALDRAVAGAELVVVSLSDYSAARSILEHVGRGTPILQLTSGTPRDARELAGWADGRALPYLDGAVMVTPDLIGTERCLVLYGGDAELFAALSSTLAALGGRAAHLGGDHGIPAALDAALLANLWGALFASLYGAALCDAEGIDLATYQTYLASLQAIVARAVPAQVERARANNYQADDTTRATLRVHRLGIDHLIATARDRGLALELPRAWATMLERAVGHDDDELAVITPFVRA